MRKLTYNEVKKYIENEGYKLLSTEYKGIREKLKIQCPKGHIYEADFHSFKTKGSRCVECNKEKERLSYEYVKGYIESFGYKLLSTKYIHSHKKLKIQCNKGHIYEVNFSNFKNGKRCPYCSGNHKYSKKEVEEYIELYNYKLLSSEYKNNRTKLVVQCDKGHIYNTTFDNFKRGKRCPKCANNKKLKHEDVKKYIENFNYKLLSNEYKNNRTKLTIQCDEGHIYECSFDNFKKGNRCPYCRTFKGEIKIEEILKNNKINYIPQYKFEDCKFKRKLPFDFYLPNYNCCIEYDGRQHYYISEYFGGQNGFIDTKIRDTIKNKYCKDNNIKLIRIPYWEINNIEEILKNELNLK